MHSTAQAWLQAAPNSILENLYGPTELTIACSAYRWDPVTSPSRCVNGIVPIGRIFSNLTSVVIDEGAHILEEGAKGELCVAGPQMFAGYWRAPELTHDRMVTRFTDDGRVERYYRTGDIVQLNADGDYIFHGRLDSQVKLNGYRIELGEIESALRSLGCQEAVALTWPAQSPEKIIAFVAGLADVGPVCEALKQRLPAYMIPAVTHVVSTMPLTTNGKVDRNALRQRLEA